MKLLQSYFVELVFKLLILYTKNVCKLSIIEKSFSKHLLQFKFT